MAVVEAPETSSPEQIAYGCISSLPLFVEFWARDIMSRNLVAPELAFVMHSKACLSFVIRSGAACKKHVRRGSKKRSPGKIHGIAALPVWRKLEIVGRKAKLS